MADETETPEGEEPTNPEAPETPAAPETPEPDNDEAVLAAVSAAVDEETVKPEDPNTSQPSGTDAPETKPGGADESEGKDQQPPAAGKDAKDGKDGEGKDEQEKEPDPVEDPIPDEIKGRTRERMESLITKVKESTKAAEKATADRDELLVTITETQATPEQFGQALDYLRLVNSGDIRGALKVMDEERAALAKMIGEPVEGVDLLASHPDLKEAVESGDMTEKYAKELASSREQRKFSEQQSAASRQTQEQHDRATAELQRGKDDLTALEASLKSDPQYAEKRALIVPILKPVLAKLPPSQWAAQFKAAYESVKIEPKAPAVPGNQPLRARQPAGEGAKGPSSMGEALDMALSGR